MKIEGKEKAERERKEKSIPRERRHRHREREQALRERGGGEEKAQREIVKKYSQRKNKKLSRRDRKVGK